MTPNQLGDYYEGIAWAALVKIYGDKLTYWGRKKKAAFPHTCGNLCEMKLKCQKHRISSGMIYTVPDFVIIEDEKPIVVHVCHWNSKETSHAKFWRTISELYELKCFMPNVQCINIVFEAEYENGKYISEGWYPEFLKVFHLLFDKTIFFNHTSLLSDGEALGDIPTFSAKAVFEEISANSSAFKSPSLLAKRIKTTTHPDVNFQLELATMWKWEREFCSTLPPFTVSPHQGEKLRNSMLQVSLISLIYEISTSEVLIALHDLFFDVKKNKNTVLMSGIVKIPVSNKDDNFQFCASSQVGAYGIQRIQLNDDLEWIVQSIKSGSLGIKKEHLIRGIERTSKLFSSSAQVVEALAGIRLFLGSTAKKDVSKWTQSDWWANYLAVDKDAEYNEVGELLLSGTCSGTYEIVSRINAVFPQARITRNDIRSFYSNKRSTNLLIKHKQLIKQILFAFKGQFDWVSGQTGFLLRKTGRIVGPQSAINPLEELLLEVLDGSKFADDCSLDASPTPYATLASELTLGESIGTWKVSASMKQSDNIIPIFLSGMKSLADCGHKTREFTGHLRLARYSIDDNKIVKNGAIKHGLAILEGGYTENEKQAFHMSGFHVASISNISAKLLEVGLTLSGE